MYNIEYLETGMATVHVDIESEFRSMQEAITFDVMNSEDREIMAKLISWFGPWETESYGLTV